MQNEKIAIIALVIIIAGALSAFFVATYWDDLIPTPPVDKGDISYGDCVDINYIGRYASNNTIFDSSYTDPENKTGGSPLKIFVSENKTDSSPEGYSNYTTNYIDGLITGLVGKKEGKSYTLEIPPEDAYGLEFRIGDSIDLSDIGQDISIELYTIKENIAVETLDPQLQQIVQGNYTDIYVLRQKFTVGEEVPLYPSWPNATVVTKVNETKIWFETNPTEENMTDFTWMETVQTMMGASSLSYWADSSDAEIDKENNTITITHNPVIGQTMSQGIQGQFIDYTVVDMNKTTINCSFINQQNNNLSYQEFDRIITLEYNETLNITIDYPKSFMEQFLEYIKQAIPDIEYSLNKLAGESLIFDVTVENLYKTSESN